MSARWFASETLRTHAAPGSVNGIDIGGDDGSNIAIVLHDESDGDTPKQTRERANLIAAAQELLEALEAALPRMAHPVACVTARPTIEWEKHGSCSFENCSCEIRLVRAALAKARGEA